LSKRLGLLVEDMYDRLVGVFYKLTVKQS